MTDLHGMRRFINQTVRTTNQFPTLREICSALNYSENQARNYMKSLAEDGYIEKIGDWYKFAENQQLSEPEEIFEAIQASESGNNLLQDMFDKNPLNEMLEKSDPHFISLNPGVKRKRGRPFGSVKKTIPGIESAQTAPEPRIEVKNEPIYKNQVRIIQAVMGIIGVGASIISIYYSYLWMKDFLPFVLAVVFAFIIVFFSIFAFETIIIFLSGEITDNKAIKIGVVTGFLLLWGIATFFSIASTVGGQVNKNLQKNESKVNSVGKNNQEQWKILKEQKADLKDSLNEYRKQAKTYNDILAGMNNMKTRYENKQGWNDVNYKLQEVQKNTQKILGDMDEVRAQEKKLLEESKGKVNVVAESNAEDKDFYLWMAKVLNVGADKIQFVLSLFFAIFIDLISPTALAISLFLRNKF